MSTDNQQAQPPSKDLPPDSTHAPHEPKDAQIESSFAESHMKYPLPPVTGSGDPWKAALERATVYDKERCDMWRDEIANVLIFAALFSAVVAAFILESTKRLEVDHAESASNLLYLISQQLDSIARQNTTTLPSLLPGPITSVQPPSFAVKVNACWYLSLCLSLIAAFIGILCLQWLREHRRDTNTSAESSLFVREMRLTALATWRLPAIVGCLPMLLLAALLLFFSGLTLLLWNLGTVVGVISGGAAGVTGLILIATSTLPIFAPGCPFRSPQARLLRYLLWHFLRALRWTSMRIMKPPQPPLLLQGGDTTWLSNLLSSLGSNNPYGDGWLKIDWMAAMDCLKQSNARDVLDVASEDWIMQLRRRSLEPWMCYRGYLAQDEDAMLAFIHCMEQKVLSGDADTHRQLLRNLLNEELRQNIGDEGNGTAGGADLVLAMCYTVAGCLSLKVRVLHRRMELHLRLLEPSRTQYNKATQHVLNDFSNVLQWHATPSATDSLAKAWDKEIQDTVYTIVTGGQADFKINVCLETLSGLFSSQKQPPDTILSLNKKLLKALTLPDSSPKPGLQVFANFSKYLRWGGRISQQKGWELWNAAYDDLHLEMHSQVRRKLGSSLDAKQKLVTPVQHIIDGWDSYIDERFPPKYRNLPGNTKEDFLRAVDDRQALLVRSRNQPAAPRA